MEVNKLDLIIVQLKDARAVIKELRNTCYEFATSDSSNGEAAYILMAVEGARIAIEDAIDVSARMKAGF